MKNSKGIGHEQGAALGPTKLSLSSHAQKSATNKEERSGPVTGILQNSNPYNRYKRKESSTGQVTIQSPCNNLQTSIGYTDMLSAFSGQGYIESNDPMSQHELLNSKLSQVQH